jgi:hypothetical protein
VLTDRDQDQLPSYQCSWPWSQLPTAHWLAIIASMNVISRALNKKLRIAGRLRRRPLSCYCAPNPATTMT